jgi:hypothetical protein
MTGTDHLNDAGLVPPAFELFEDFLREDGVADSTGPFDWNAVNSGTFATDAGNGGLAKISGAATTNASGGQIQAEGIHVVTANKLITYKTRAQLNESTSANVATASALYLGLFPVNTGIIASFPDDGIYFEKDAGTVLKANVKVGGTVVGTTTLTVAADKLVHSYGIAIFPRSLGGTASVVFIIDGVVVASYDNLTLPASTVYLSPSVAFQTGDNTGTKWIDVDYVGSFQQR